MNVLLAVVLGTCALSGGPLGQSDQPSIGSGDDDTGNVLVPQPDHESRQRRIGAGPWSAWPP